MSTMASPRAQTEGLGTHFQGAALLRGAAARSLTCSSRPSRAKPMAPAVCVPKPFQFGNEERTIKCGNSERLARKAPAATCPGRRRLGPKGTCRHFARPFSYPHLSRTPPLRSWAPPPRRNSAESFDQEIQLVSNGRRAFDGPRHLLHEHLPVTHSQAMRSHAGRSFTNAKFRG